MDLKDEQKHESLPIPTYEQATSSRPTSSQSGLGPEEVSDDAERQGLLRYSRRNDPSSRDGYQQPTVESARSSLDLPSEDERPSEEALRQEMQQMDVEDPNSDNGSHRSLLTNRFSKHITSLTSSLSSFSLPSLRRLLPSRISWPLLPAIDLRSINTESNRAVVLGRCFGALLIATVVYVFIASDIITFGAHGPRFGQIYPPEAIRIYVQQHMNEHGKMQEYLEHITQFPHMAGTEGNYVLGEWVQDLFDEASLEGVGVERFDVYLNYPRKDGRRVAIVDPPEMKREALIEEEQAYTAPPREQTYVFHGHSKSGNVTGPLIYANYGSRDDFQWLKDQGISLEGAIVLVRYYGSQGDRALKVKAAELAGGVGCIIYSDPQQDGFVKGEVWPLGRYMPADGVQRGAVSLMSWVVGDVLSPGWASTPGEKERLQPEDSRGLNKIPSIPIAWRDAEPLLQALNGHGKQLPGDWKGGVGPPELEWWSGDSSSPTVNLMNLQDEEVYQPIYNVLGRIEGWEQDQKKVIVGNHRDAWCFGGADPGSGTAVMLEVIRVFGELRKLGWRPLRTIEFASWDGEEYNLIGSTEHVENRIDELRRDGYAYINVDVAVRGSNFKAAASPLFERVLLRVLDRTSDPIRNQTLRQLWDEKKVGIEGLGAGSDYVAFQDIAGTSSIDMSFDGPPYPYHSCYDNYDWMANFGDPGFVYHQLMGEVWALLILELADRPVLPFDMEAYATAVSSYVNDLNRYVDSQATYANGDENTDLDLMPLRKAAVSLVEEAKAFHDWDRWWAEVVGIDRGFESKTVSVKRRAHNNRMANFETHLLDLEEGGGLPNRTQFKHVIFAPQAWSGYDEAYFPGIRDAVDAGNWTEAQQQVSKAAGLITRAARKLNHN